jgi:hypothetical protein
MWKQCDMMSDDIGRGLISTGRKKPSHGMINASVVAECM